ncbi:hypothetical protein OUZ56_022425 [Daphnia magna]|uniref:Uncharacterized protein n=1 Tax=Daphnia magna TaxID=35525 RepID=A0ABR0AWD3_9CRUS|nr:hypothetical protein OUZ56_022425 [Daphnia magna]
MESLDWFTTKSQGPLILAHFWQQRRPGGYGELFGLVLYGRPANERRKDRTPGRRAVNVRLVAPCAPDGFAIKTGCNSKARKTKFM